MSVERYAQDQDMPFQPPPQLHGSLVPDDAATDEVQYQTTSHGDAQDERGPEGTHNHVPILDEDGDVIMDEVQHDINNNNELQESEQDQNGNTETDIIEAIINRRPPHTHGTRRQTTGRFTVYRDPITDNNANRNTNNNPREQRQFPRRNKTLRPPLAEQPANLFYNRRNPVFGSTGNIAGPSRYRFANPWGGVHYVVSHNHRSPDISDAIAAVHFSMALGLEVPNAALRTLVNAANTPAPVEERLAQIIHGSTRALPFFMRLRYVVVDNPANASARAMRDNTPRRTNTAARNHGIARHLARAATTTRNPATPRRSANAPPNRRPVFFH